MENISQEFDEIFSPSFLKNDEFTFEPNKNYNNFQIKNQLFYVSSFSYIENTKNSPLNTYNNNEANQAFDDILKTTENHKMKNKILLINKKTQRSNNSIDNLVRRVKKIVFTSLLNYDNYIISKIYNNNLGNGITIKKLLRIKHHQIKNVNSNFNKELLKTSQGNIFSTDISNRYNNYPNYHNRQLIKKLLNEKDDEKRKRFNNLFNKTFLECIQYIRGKKEIQGLEGLEKFYEQEMLELNEDENYKNELKKTINNYEKIFMKKKPRKKNNN